MEKQYRHGDVFVREVAAIPEGGAEMGRDAGRVVLAYGEVTGHAHAFGPAERVRMFRSEGPAGLRRHIDVARGGAALRHEEHTEIRVPEGLYEVIQQREYSPEAVRNVAD